jgi:uncharacterized protein (UPF0335 family)
MMDGEFESDLEGDLEDNFDGHLSVSEGDKSDQSGESDSDDDDPFIVADGEGEDSISPTVNNDGGDDAPILPETFLRVKPQVEPTGDYRPVVVRRDASNCFYFLFVKDKTIKTVPVDDGSCVYNVRVERPEYGVKHTMNRAAIKRCKQYNMKTLVVQSAVEFEGADDGDTKKQEKGYDGRGVYEERLRNAKAAREELLSQLDDATPDEKEEINEDLKEVGSEINYARKWLEKGSSEPVKSGSEPLHEILFYGSTLNQRATLQEKTSDVVYVEIDRDGNLLEYPVGNDESVEDDNREVVPGELLKVITGSRRTRAGKTQAQEKKRIATQEVYSRVQRLLREKKTLKDNIRDASTEATRGELHTKLTDVTHKLRSINSIDARDPPTFENKQMVYKIDEGDKNFPVYSITKLLENNRVELYPILTGNVDRRRFEICDERNIRPASDRWIDKTAANWLYLYIKLNHGAPKLANDTKVLFWDKTDGVVEGVLKPNSFGLPQNIIYTAVDGRYKRHVTLKSVPREYYTPKFESGAKVLSRKNPTWGVGKIQTFANNHYSIKFKTKKDIQYVDIRDVCAAAGGKPAAARSDKTGTAIPPKSQSAKADKFQVGALVVKPNSKWGAARIEGRDGDEVWVNFKNTNEGAEPFDVKDLRIAVAPRTKTVANAILTDYCC